MSSYCTIADVYRWIPRGIVQNPARLLGGAAPATDVFTLGGHGLADDDQVTFRAEAGGTLPAGIVAGTTYYAIVLSDATFQVSATAGGAAVDFTAAGTNTLLICALPWAAWIVEASAEIESTMPAHAVPLLAPYPAIVIAYTAGLVAEKAVAFAGVGGPPDFAERLKRVRSELGVWRSNGIPIRGTSAPVSANLAVSGGVLGADARGWAVRGDGVLP